MAAIHHIYDDICSTSQSFSVAWLVEHYLKRVVRLAVSLQQPPISTLLLLQYVIISYYKNQDFLAGRLTNFAYRPAKAHLLSFFRILSHTNHEDFLNDFGPLPRSPRMGKAWTMQSINGVRQAYEGSYLVYWLSDEVVECC